MTKFFKGVLAITAFLGMTGVMIGAFGAHFLKSRIDELSNEVLRTGVLYLFVHSIVLLVIVVLGRYHESSRILKGAALSFIIGIILFSGSLFFIATQSLMEWDIGYFGIVTPIGGLCFIVGWLLLFGYALSRRN